MQLGLSLVIGDITASLPIVVPGDFDTLWTITGAEVSTMTEFVTVQISGSGAITVIGTTEYSQNEGAFTADAGTIVDGDTLAIRYTSSGTNSNEVAGGVIIGGVTCNASLTTKAAGNTWDDISGNPILDINGNPIEVF